MLTRKLDTDYRHQSSNSSSKQTAEPVVLRAKTGWLRDIDYAYCVMA
jgi:hypothetical protein